MEKQRLKQIERYVLGFIKEQQQARILAKEPSLTPQGIAPLGLEQANVEGDVAALPHPPKSATKSV